MSSSSSVKESLRLSSSMVVGPGSLGHLKQEKNKRSHVRDLRNESGVVRIDVNLTILLLFFSQGHVGCSKPETDHLLEGRRVRFGSHCVLSAVQYVYLSEMGVFPVRDCFGSSQRNYSLRSLCTKCSMYT